MSFGLSVAFQLIKESCHSHPDLCIKALHALLDVLQGQLPEGLKSKYKDSFEVLINCLI